jgi:hypothetical protein
MVLWYVTYFVWLDANILFLLDANYLVSLVDNIAVSGGSLSLRHGSSSYCGWRKGHQYGG